MPTVEVDAGLFAALALVSSAARRYLVAPTDKRQGELLTALELVDQELAAELGRRARRPTLPLGTRGVRRRPPDGDRG